VKLIRLNPTTQQNVVTYDVVISVDNPEEILLPGMTAYVSIVVARRQDVLRVPNAALRYKPPAAATAGAATAGAAAGQTRRTGSATGTVYVLEGMHIKPVSLSVGITDGRNTEVLSGDIKPGDKLVVADLQPSGEQAGGTVRFRMF